jgi:hypothetical protein
MNDTSVKRTLNYWMNSKPFSGEFLGFVYVSADSHIGLKVDGFIAPMFLFQNDTGWGDGTPTSKKFSWVLYIKGVDDHSLYMLFGVKEGAIKYANSYILGDDMVVNPHDDEYNGRKWNWQN